MGGLAMAILEAGWEPMRWHSWRVPTRSLTIMSMSITPVSAAEITLIHMGDLHGHLMPRPSIRGETTARTEGGLARMYTKISQIRAKHSNTLLFNTGDTIQGSAEALFTKGQALVDVLNRFSINAYVLGNWDWVYGVERALELFAGPSPKAPWNALAANAYYEGEPYASRAGSRVLPPYLIREIDGVKIGTDGVVYASYADGSTKPLYRIPLATVSSPDNLTVETGNVYSQSASSGVIITGFPGEGTFGTVKSNALEASNVDLASELTEMIQAQRSYTANSKVFQTGSDLMDVLVNLQR